MRRHSPWPWATLLSMPPAEMISATKLSIPWRYRTGAVSQGRAYRRPEGNHYRGEALLDVPNALDRPTQVDAGYREPLQATAPEVSLETMDRQEGEAEASGHQRFDSLGAAQSDGPADRNALGRQLCLHACPGR